MSRRRDPIQMEGGPTYQLDPLPAKRPNRPKISPQSRKRVFKRDNYCCCNCGETDRRVLTIDHKHPLGKGGEHRERNYQTLCLRCNQEKADSMP